MKRFVQVLISSSKTLWISLEDASTVLMNWLARHSYPFTLGLIVSKGRTSVKGASSNAWKIRSYFWLRTTKDRSFFCSSGVRVSSYLMSVSSSYLHSFWMRSVVLCLL